MKCTICKYEDTNRCNTCQDPDRDEIKINLQKILKAEGERIGGKLIDEGRTETDLLSQ